MIDALTKGGSIRLKGESLKHSQVTSRDAPATVHSSDLSFLPSFLPIFVHFHAHRIAPRSPSTLGTSTQVTPFRRRAWQSVAERGRAWQSALRASPAVLTPRVAPVNGSASAHAPPPILLHELCVLCQLTQLTFLILLTIETPFSHTDTLAYSLEPSKPKPDVDPAIPFRCKTIARVQAQFRSSRRTRRAWSRTLLTRCTDSERQAPPPLETCNPASSSQTTSPCALSRRKIRIRKTFKDTKPCLNRLPPVRTRLTSSRRFRPLTFPPLFRTDLAPSGLVMGEPPSDLRFQSPTSRPRPGETRSRTLTLTPTLIMLTLTPTRLCTLTQTHTSPSLGGRACTPTH